jgi:hypothetical protein
LNWSSQTSFGLESRAQKFRARESAGGSWRRARRRALPARNALQNDTADTGQVSAVKFQALILRRFFAKLSNRHQN